MSHAVSTRQPVVKPALTSSFPFGVEFQKALLRLLSEDAGFAGAAMPHLVPGFFENEVLAWAYQVMVEYHVRYNAIPSLKLIQDEATRLDASVRELYRLTLEQVVHADLTAEEWLRDQTLDFIKRNLYVRAHQESTISYNGGDVSKAYDIMTQAMDRILNTDWSPPDRSFFFEELEQRVSRRLSADPMMDSISTGIHELDFVLVGGLSKGELGIWVADSKVGKTTFLTNLGVQAVRRGNHNTLHIVFEGGREQVEDRYDTIFAQEDFHQVRSWDVPDDTFKRMKYDYRMFTRRMVVRGFTDDWNYTAVHIHEELKELKRLYNWIPALIIVDYGDLMRGRGQQRTETEHQRAAFRDLKTLANRGYAVWTASQAQRPEDDDGMKTTLLMARKIADAYDKVRVADFIGTLNQTKEEKDHHQMRLYAELYRGNAAGRLIHVTADFPKMTITGLRNVSEAAIPAPVHGPVPLGYIDGEQPKQTKAPI